jgi:hypothetical protein
MGGRVREGERHVLLQNSRCATFGQRERGMNPAWYASRIEAAASITTTTTTTGNLEVDR